MRMGKLPIPGEDAALKYFIDLKSISATELTGVVKTEDKTIICRKIPAKFGIDGYTVRGKPISSSKPKDIIVEPGANVSVSSYGLDFISYIDGIVSIQTEYSSLPDVKSVIHISIDPLEVVDGSKAVKISTDKTIEITGGLKAGSQVVTQGKVYVNGNIEKGTMIATSSDLIISGDVIGGDISSDRDIDKAGNISGSKLSAKGKLKVFGKVVNSELSGDEVIANEVVGSTIIAGSRLEINSICSGEDGRPSVIRAGSTVHKKTIIDANQKFIKFADSNLEKFSDIFGDSIVETANPANVSLMLLTHTKNLRQQSLFTLTDEKAKALKTILGSIGPMRNLMTEKIDANETLHKEIRDLPPSDSQIIIKNPVKDKVRIFMEDCETEIGPSEGSTMLKYSQGNLVKTQYFAEA